jgi:hypothetical protein
MSKQFRDTKYFVSEEGVVKSFYSVGGDNRFKKGKPSSNRERIVGKGKSNDYHVVKPKNHNGWLVHQMVMETWGTSKPEGDYVIDHIDENKTNNHINNLQWIERGENIRKSAMITGRSRKLTLEDADEIRNKYKPRSYTRQKLADEYGVSISTIKSILIGRYY